MLRKHARQEINHLLITSSNIFKVQNLQLQDKILEKQPLLTSTQALTTFWIDLKGPAIPYGFNRTWMIAKLTGKIRLAKILGNTQT